MINEIKESVQDGIKERLSSPILGSYILFFLGYHWKMWVLLFWSEKEGQLKIEELSSVWPQTSHDFTNPAAITLVFIFTYPFLKLIYSFFIKTVNLAQLRYDLILTRTELSLDELKQKQAIEKRKSRINVLREHGLNSEEDYIALTEILKNSVESNTLPDSVRNEIKIALKEKTKINI